MTAIPVANIRSVALRTIRLEAEAIAGLEALVDDQFEKSYPGDKYFPGPAGD